MSRFLPYSPDQAYLLPPSVKDELGEDHLSIFVHRVVERLDRSVFEKAYSEEGGALYAPELMLKVWLYAYALGIPSARRLEQRIREDLGLRYLAGGQQPDNWALSAFRRRHWQKACEASDPDEGAGTRVRVEELERRLAELPRRLERLRKSGESKLSRRDGEARFLRERGGFALGYTAEIAVSEDHLIVAQRVTLHACDVPALVPLVEEVEQRTGVRPGKALADAGFYSNEREQARAHGEVLPGSRQESDRRHEFPPEKDMRGTARSE